LERNNIQDFKGGFYWPTLFLQVGEKFRGCVSCQMFVGKQKIAALPQVPSIISAPSLQ